MTSTSNRAGSSSISRNSKLLSFLFMLLASSGPSHAQVIDDTIKIGSTDVELQRLTLQCGGLDRRFQPGTKSFTIHLLNMKKVPDGTKVRPAAHGWFEWDSNEWHEFANINENHILLWRFDPWWTGRSYSACSDARLTINRSTLEATSEIRRDAECTRDNVPAAPAAAALLDSGGRYKSSSKCEIVKYQPPPQRIGF